MEEAVEAPTSEELAEALQELGVRHVWEDKHYPRDALQEGRCRADLAGVELPPGNKKIALLREAAAKVVVLRAVKEAEAAEQEELNKKRAKAAPKSKKKRK